MKELKPGLMGKKSRYKTNKDSLYYGVVLMKNDGTPKTYRVHKLVALFFLPNPRYYKIVDHIDGNKFNNRASNLRWCTNKQNLNNPNSNVIRPVARFTLDGEYIDDKPSITAYQEEFGFNIKNIWSCLNGRQKSANGYKWMYLDKQGYLENF